MSMKRCVILNPKAGAVRDLNAVLKALEPLGTKNIRFTEKKGGAAAHARRAIRSGCDEIIVAGGDGTLNEVINGAGEHVSEISIGLIPLGTGNDFARTLNLPTSIEANLAIIHRRALTAIDVVRARSERRRFFVNVSAGGFSGVVNEKLTAAMKKTWGPLAYVRSAAAAFPEMRAYKTIVEFEDEQSVSADLYNVIIANGRYVAGGLPIAPEATPTDGLLDVVLITARPTSKMVMVAAEILLGKHLHRDSVIFRRARRVTVRSRPGMWFNVDGELVGNDPITFEVMPRALQFFAPK
jgi:diacylglycerol kinase (ATP)